LIDFKSVYVIITQNQIYKIPSTELPASGSVGIISARYIKAPLFVIVRQRYDENW